MPGLQDRSTTSFGWMNGGRYKGENGMKISSIIKDYFSFNRKEQRGLFVLISVITGLIIADVFISEVLPQKSVDFSGFEKEIMEFEKEVSFRDSVETAEKGKRSGGKYYQSSGVQIDSMKTRSFEKDELIIELNAADTFDLQRLRGIGPSFANRIIKYRDRLGRYYEKSQLLEVFGMDSERYDRIKDHVMVDPEPIRKINLNSVTFKELMKHPYFPFEVTKSIMLYRKEHKKFNEVQELRSLKYMNDSLFRKINPYIRTD